MISPLFDIMAKSKCYPTHIDSGKELKEEGAFQKEQGKFAQKVMYRAKLQKLSMVPVIFMLIKVL